MKGYYIKNSYDVEPPAEVLRKEVSSATATAYPVLQRTYADPGWAAGCLEELAAPTSANEVWAYGLCLVDAPAPTGGASGRAGCRSKELVTFKGKFTGEGACAGKGHTLDSAVLAQAVLEAGEGMVAYERDLHGNLPDVMPAPVLAGWRNAVSGTALLLRTDAEFRPKGNTRRPDLPSLALSGGAANGAFTAGYLHTMMELRERLLAELASSPEARRKVEGEAFGLAATTSVGTLAALAWDLYAVDPDVVLTPEEDAAVRSRLKLTPDASLGERPLQRAAMLVLDASFKLEEQDLFCAEPRWTHTLLLGQSENALRFDKLYEDTIEPFFTDYGRLVSSNDFIRYSMAADIDQNLLLPLDERVCATLDTRSRTLCLTNQVAASITEPTYARAVRDVMTPFPDFPLLPGTWLDGGLRSGTPAALALAAGNNRVLSVSTHRSEGIPGRIPKNGFAILLRSVGQIVEQTRTWEQAYAVLAEDSRKDEYEAILEWLLVEEGVKPANAVGFPSSLLLGDLRPVFIADAPEDLFPLSVALGGYTFDPALTRALYLWGEIRALEEYEDERRWLSRPALNELFSKEGEERFRDGLTDLHDAKIAELRAHVIEELQPPEGMSRSVWHVRHAKERRAVLRKNLKLCSGSPHGEPPSIR